MTALHPPSTLLMGPAGTGKTTSLVTLLASGLKLRMLATEPSAPNRVLEECKKRGISDAAFDWQYISPSVPSWDSLIQSAKIVNTLDLKSIAEMKGGIAKQDGMQWIKMLEAIAGFTSDRTGVKLGDATLWDTDCAFALDGLTGINTMSRNLTVGLKPNPAPGEWGVMQSNILNLLKKLCSDCRCFFVVIAHVERETSELTGMSNVTVSTLGAKLAPKLPPEFTNVILSKRIAANFLWSVADTGVDTKPGDLAFLDNLPPDFSPIVSAYRARSAAQNSPASSAGNAAGQPAPSSNLQPQTQPQLQT